MSRDAEDDDHTTFIQLGGLYNESGEEPVLSRAAFQLHGFGVVNSVRDGHPGFISGDYLNAISAETSVTATELCMAGMWRRVKGGYEVLDRTMLDVAVKADRQQTEMAEKCRETGGHEPDPEEPSICHKCLARLP
ncbi:hypothetical protein O7622_26395 [Micromonospora sp. WMMD1076]|uniref:hypothetical protein n=1 Tax=Micromonospora sp. WMMD1076 TaxID=3016103 RepID=UPI00249B0768|nr:hypothetical protein [Micromonospora sp. WMMD1076]WFF06536.1 hypothetical protein O7622_26395 [Micromonospora sp. WMMD1076]